MALDLQHIDRENAPVLNRSLYFEVWEKKIPFKIIAQQHLCWQEALVETISTRTNHQLGVCPLLPFPISSKRQQEAFFSFCVLDLLN